MDLETRTVCLPLEDDTCHLDLDDLREEAATLPCEELAVVQGAHVEAI